jgi:hypothetical protein
MKKKFFLSIGLMILLTFVSSSYNNQNNNEQKHDLAQDKSKRDYSCYMWYGKRFDWILDLYNKRMFSLQELTYRLNHGGYTQADVDELNLVNTYSGFTGLMTPRFPWGTVTWSTAPATLRLGN